MQKGSLPSVSAEEVKQLQISYDLMQAAGGEKLQDARIRLLWGLAHSQRRDDNRRGINLGTMLLSHSTPSKEQTREVTYLKAVAQYNAGQALEARLTCQDLLLEFPNFRQGQVLKKLVDDKVTTDGLIGVGVGATALAAVAAIAAIALGGGKK